MSDDAKNTRPGNGRRENAGRDETGREATAIPPDDGPSGRRPRSGGDLPRQPIVSSAHLAGDFASLSEFEFALITCTNAFNRWMVRCMAAAGQPDLSPLEVLILHNVNHRDREKKLSELAFTLNIEDTHTVSYALKKLKRAGLVDARKDGKEMLYTTSDDGKDLCARYKAVRDACLVGAMDDLETVDRAALSDLARMIRVLSGQYDQAARAAASL